MRRSLEHRDIEFRGTPGGALERVVRLPDKREYTHRCSKEVFEAVAGHLDDHQRDGVKIQSLADALDAPMTQVNVALQLLTERGLLETHGRLGYVAPGYASAFFEHAMTEFYALIEGHPPEFPDG
jgi:DNA-binding GntR family transcriptional regulator